MARSCLPDSLLATSSPETPPHSLKGVRRLKFPLGGIIVCLVMAVDQLRAFECLLAIAIAYAVVVTGVESCSKARSLSLIAARVLTLVLAGVLSGDISAAPAVVSLSLAGVVAAPTLLRWDMRRQPNHLPYQRESTVVTLTVQAVLTLAYVLLNRAFVVAVPVAEWALLVGSTLIAQRVFRPFGADDLHIDAVAGIVAVLEPQLGVDTAGILCAFLMALTATGRHILRPRHAGMRWWWLSLQIYGGGLLLHRTRKLDGVWWPVFSTPPALALAVGLAAGLVDEQTALGAALTVPILVVICCVEVPRSNRLLVAEIGTIVWIAALHRGIFASLSPDPFWLAQCFVAGAAVLAAAHYLRGESRPGKWHVGAGALLLSVTSLSVIVTGDPSLQIWALVDPAVLLVLLALG